MVQPAGDSRSLLRALPIAVGLLAADGERYASIKSDLRRWAKDDPVDALVATVVGGGIAFYLAERDTNPACAKPWDGILYIATCLSVGYDNLFPTTPTGHALASAVQTFGPALAGMAFDDPAGEVRAAEQAARDEAAAARAADEAARAEAAAIDRAILARLDDIVRLLGEGKR
jgi:hypothetical protein